MSSKWWTTKRFQELSIGRNESKPETSICFVCSLCPRQQCECMGLEGCEDISLESNASQSERIQADYEIMRRKVLAGENLREGDHTFFATCPKHGGGYLKESPLESPRSSLAVHPVMGFAEKRGYCIKREAFIELIADAIGSPLVKIGRTVGIESDKLEL